MSAPPSPPSLSIFFPAYNDSGTIGSLVIRALQVAETLTPDYEVIVVNDGSRGDTGEILDELARLYPSHFRPVHHPVNRGYGGALRTGFASVREAASVHVKVDGIRRFNHLNPVAMQHIYERWVGKYQGDWASALVGLKRTVEEKTEARRAKRA